MVRDVERGLMRRAVDDVSYIGIDEKTLLKRHRNVALAFALERKVVLDEMTDRTEERCHQRINLIL